MTEAAMALGLEAALGYPQALQRRIGHPVQWAGALIDGLDRSLNLETDTDARRRLKGAGATVLIVMSGATFGLALERMCGRSRFSPVLRALAATPGLAQLSLFDHVLAVLRPLRAGRLDEARSAVSRVVGRDVDALDESGVAKAALESLAESFNDGVAAPAFWLALGGLPGLYAYKALNTADSMIGHKEPRWRAFGWASARGDDLANFIPARIAGAVIALAGGGGWRAMVDDAHKHASPNAGWPEAAMAAALKVRLGGSVSYDGAKLDRPVFNDGDPEPTAHDLDRGVAVYGRACALLGAALLVYGLVKRRTS
jgi:adenosylcobinamide-phosphate synthase